MSDAYKPTSNVGTAFKVVSDNPKAPKIRVAIEIVEALPPGKYELPLFLKTRKDGTPIMDKADNQLLGGKIKLDDYKPQGGGGNSGDQGGW